MSRQNDKRLEHHMNLVATLQKNLGKGRRRLKLLCLALVLSISVCHQAAFASALSQLAASLQPGQFAELTGMNGFNNGDIMNTPEVPGCTSADTITEYGNRAVWSTQEHAFYFLGGSHGNCYGMRFVKYTDSTNTWSNTGQVPLSCAPNFSQSCGGHAYDHNAISATGDVYYRGYNSKQVYKYSGGAWTSIASVPMGSTQCCGALEWF